MSDCEYVVDRLVPMAIGQENTVLQYLIRGSCTDLYCAKIGSPATVAATVKASRAVHERRHWVCLLRQSLTPFQSRKAEFR